MPPVKLLRDYDFDELLAEAAPYLLREQPRDAKGRFDFGTGKDESAKKGVSAGEPKRGAAALRSPPKSLAAMTKEGDPRAEALWYRTGDNSMDMPDGMPGHFGMGQYLRHGGDDPEMQARVDDIDSVMGDSRLSSPVLVYRGVPTSMLGRPGELTGVEFRDKGFPATTTNIDHANKFGSATARITVPKGTGAIRMADRDSKRPESEIMLDRDLKFRITGERFDHDARGRVVNHEIDMEVVP